MALYKYVQKSWKKPTLEMRQKVRAWRRQSVVKRIERPTRIDRARSLGYKAKQGFVIVRVRILKGMRRRQSPRKGRKPRSLGVFYTPKMNKQAIAERRAARKFPNLEVLNSYNVGRDGNYNYYEIILVDKHHPSIQNDRDVSWVVNQRRRAFRGLTSAGRKSRGL